MKADKILYPGTAWWLLLLIPAVFFGFYPAYFSRLLSPMDHIFHVHTFFMGLWVVLAILQPILIRKRKIRLHRAIGRLSYLVMPLVLASAYLVIRHSYFTRINEASVQSGSLSKTVIGSIQEGMIIGIVYLAWLALFYSLAVIFRKRLVYHATLMFAAILTLLGPTVDRIIYHVYQYFGLSFDFFAEAAVFGLIDVLLLGLLFYQWRKGYDLRPAAIALAIYLAGQFGYFLLPKTQAWKNFVTLIMQ